MRTHSLLLLAALSLAFAPAPFRRPDRVPDPKDELRRLQGEWVRVSLHIDGKQSTGHVAMRITGNRMDFGQSDVWDIRLDPGPSPRRIDLVRVNQPASVFVGIYRLEGDSLTFCSRLTGSTSERPAAFDSSARGVWFEVYQRKKH